jgi:hypothetical protein
VSISGPKPTSRIAHSPVASKGVVVFSIHELPRGGLLGNQASGSTFSSFREDPEAKRGRVEQAFWLRI